MLFLSTAAIAESLIWGLDPKASGTCCLGLASQGRCFVAGLLAVGVSVRCCYRADGYAKRFGVVYVDYTNHLQRHTKKSAKWLSEYFGGRQD